MYRSFVPLVALAGLLATAPAALAQDPPLDTDANKTLYTLGLMVSRQMGVPFLTDEEVQIVQAGLADGLLGREPRLDPTPIVPQIDNFLAYRLNQAVEEQRSGAAKLLERAVGEEGAVKLESGVVYIEGKPGDGDSPGAGDSVAVNFRGYLWDGRIFDYSQPGSPSIFKLEDMVDCLSEGLQRMKVGGRSRVVCPPETAYGEQGNAPRILPGAALLFDVELVGVVPPAPGSAPTPGG
jgi:FKBP-type peptidyl-prolyl cis-trans isomerase FkpA/FKBP-type peptidyl-prolyl cis-trans isomerase FklB